MTFDQVLTALSILRPLVEQVIDHVNGGDDTPELKALPPTVRSRLALERAKQRAAKP